MGIENYEVVKDDDQEIGRLTDMDTREVSVVDRAANQREFLMIKSENSGGNMGAEASKTTVKTGTEDSKDISKFSLRLKSVSEKLSAIKEAVEKAEEGESGTISSLVSTLRRTQLMLKSVSGHYDLVGTVVPAQNLGGFIITPLAKTSFVNMLDETIRRTAELSKSLESVSLLDADQSRQIESISNMIGSCLGENSEDEISKISSSSVEPEELVPLVKSITDSIETLTDIRVSLETEARKSATSAGRDVVVKYIQQVASGLGASIVGKSEAQDEQEETSYGKAIAAIISLEEMQNLNAEDPLTKSEEVMDNVVKSFIDVLDEVDNTTKISRDAVLKADDNAVNEEEAETEDTKEVEKSQNLGFLTSVVKAATLFVPRWSEESIVVVKRTDDETISKHETWLAAEKEALRLNMIEVFGISKSEEASVDKAEEVAEEDVAKSEEEKVKVTMQKQLLTRMQEAVKLLKDAFGDLKSGSVPMEKFKKVGEEFSSIIMQLRLEKAAMLQRGMTDTRGLTQDAPNQGSGIQPDEDAVAGIEAIGGEGTIGLDNVLKSEEIQKRDSEILVLKAEVAAIKKRRSAPSVSSEDLAPIAKSAEDSAWPRDMTSWNDKN